MSAQSLFLAFGKVSNPQEAYRHEGAVLMSRGQHLGRQVAVVGSTTPAFRLNSRGWMAPQPQLVAALPDRAALRLLCRDRIEAMTPAFSARARSWTADYLDQAEAAAGPPETDLHDVEAPSDRYFASLLPMPAMHVAAFEPPDDPLGSFVALELGLWDGATLTGILFGGGATITPGTGVALDRLVERAGPLLSLHRVDTRAEGAALARALIAAADVPPPWFGPYRAEGFHAALP